MKALIVIDYTVDFVTGKLPVGDPAVAIEKQLVKVTEEFINNGDYVVMAVDLHEENDQTHPEFHLFPPHNIRGTEGRELFGELREIYEKHADQIKWMDKTRYSAFYDTGLEEDLRQRGIDTVHLVGVCTDICVLHTAVDAYNKGFRIVVHSNAAASFNQQGHTWALGHFRDTLGAQVVE